MIMCGWGQAIEGWAMSLRAAGRSPGTVELRLGQVGRLRRHVTPRGLGPWDVTGDDLESWLGAASWQAETRRSLRTGLRLFYRWAIKAGHTRVNPADELAPIKPKAPDPQPVPVLVYTHALASADDRLRLMLRLALDCGLRRAEVAAVHVDDVEVDLAGYTLRVKGKGGKVRRVPLPDALARELRRSFGPGGWLFPGNYGGHLSPRWVGKLVARALPGVWTMHKLRHRFATDAFAVDKDLFSVQELCGWASPVTAQAYILRPDDDRRRIVNAAATARAAVAAAS